MMERQEIESLFAKIDTVEAANLPERWWDRSAFQERGIVDLVMFMVVLGADKETVYRDIFRGMCELPQGRRVRVLNPPKDALMPFLEAWNRRDCGGSLQIDSEGHNIAWTDFKGDMRLAIPVMFLIYKAERGSPGFW